MKKLLSLVIISLLLLNGVRVVAQNTTNIPLDSRVRHGKLTNGLTYYIMHNEEPKERVSLYFVQNVGAILEEDSQNGLAHFLEHMAFNGLEHFPGKSMLNYLESNGIKFGADINAYTIQDETVYNLSNLPANNENLIDSALLVLHDWSGSLLLEDDEIDAERGVIREEWRTRRTSSFRLLKQKFPYLYNHSKYAQRDVIGSLDVINNFKYQELRDYYNKWYRPDLQAVVIVGDIDVNKIEGKIQELFSKIVVKENPAKREYYTIEDSRELSYVVAKDKEARGVSIEWYFRKDATTLKDEVYLRGETAMGILSSMLNSRLIELTQKPDCPALGMGVGFFEMVRTKNAAFVSVNPKDNEEVEAFRLVLTELERAKRFGFNESEFQRVKTNLLSQYDSYERTYDKVENEAWANQLAEHFLKATPFPSLKWEMAFYKKTIQSITLDEVTAYLTDFDNIDNSFIAVSGPDNNEVNYPTKNELLAEYNKVKQLELTAYVDEALDDPLVKDTLEEGKIISETKIKGVDAKLYTLDNGAKIIVFPTQFSQDEILLSGFSFGGSSVLNTNMLASADIATSLASMSGVGEFNAIQLSKKLTGKITGISPYISTEGEGFSGSSSVKDFETMLQLLYQQFEHPRFDEEAYQTLIESLKNQLIYLKEDNQQAYKDTINMVVSNYHERSLVFNKTFVEQVDFEKAKLAYKDRIQDASDFTFVLVGNIDVKKHLPLIKKYIGSLSSNNRKESWVNHNIKPAKGNTSRVLERNMEVDKATVFYSLYKDVKYNLKTRMYVRFIADLLSKRYMETIREEEGGSYGVGVQPDIIKRPYEHAEVSVYFDCDPDKHEKLIEIMKKEIDLLVNNGVNEKDLKEIQNNYIKNREEAENQNSYWLSVIQNSLINNEDIVDITAFNELVNGISAKDVQDFARELFKNNDSVEVILLPKK